MAYKRIFFFSTGRVGSTYITNIINTLTNSEIVAHQKKYAKLTNIVGHMYMTGFLNSKNIDKAIQFFEGAEIPNSTSDPLRSILVAIFLSNYSEKLNYKIIHLVRDPRDFVTSFMNWKNRKLSGLVAHHIIPFWQPNPFHTKEVSFYRWTRMSKFEHYCWLWNYKNTFLIDLFKGNKDYTMIRLEDLVSDNFEVHWKRLFELLEFSFNNEISQKLIDKKVNISNKKFFPKWEDWDTSQSKILDRHCGILMKRLGYGEEISWQEKLV
jgi:hypothetical protein